ncbi:hypothetical protein DyAD56_18320 [Dyella sp. AD56]|nr:hypothetical protein DyAD56_18320 [Dyella sp. AD56]
MRRELGKQVASITAREQRTFGGSIGVVERDAQHETIELRIGQGERASEIQRILRGDDKERLRQHVRLAVHRHLTLRHGLEQGALCFGRGAVDFVGEQQASEDRAGMKAELPRLALVDADADNVRGQQVAGELHALEIQCEAGGQSVCQRGLANAWYVLQQKVPTCQ